ncbi:unnamed protein product [Closterium sp. NIES-54]
MFGHPNNAPGFKLKARVDEDPDAGSRRYTTPETGTWWNDAQKAWPLMMTLANISQAKRWGKAGHTLLALLPIPPSAMSAVEKVMLFQHCVITVLQPLLDGIARSVLGLHLAKTSSHHVHGTAWGNPYLVVMPDIMHQMDLGIMSHIVAVVRKMKKRRVKQMDRSVFWGLDSLLFITFTQTISSPQMDAVRAYLGWYILCSQPQGHTERSLRELKKMTSR